MTLPLSARDRATLVVALRAWQNELGYYTLSELREYYPALKGHQPLSIAEVDELLARLGVSPPQGSSKATVSSVSTVSAEGGAS